MNRDLANVLNNLAHEHFITHTGKKSTAALLNFMGPGCRGSRKTNTQNFISFVSRWKLIFLTLSWRRPLSYRNQSIDLQSKSVDWFLYDNGLRHERVKATFRTFLIQIKFTRSSQKALRMKINVPVDKIFQSPRKTLLNVLIV